MTMIRLTRHPPGMWPYLWLGCDPTELSVGSIIRTSIVPMLFPQAWPMAVGMRGELQVRGRTDADFSFTFAPMDGVGFAAAGVLMADAINNRKACAHEPTH